MWDFFISHASEDKEAIARPLATELRSRGYDVWYDEFTLTIGDSLRESIDKGLRLSRYGIVILSPNFFQKNWPKEELDGLFTRQIQSGEKVVLPVWHNVTRDYVADYSVMLAGKLGVPTSSGFNNVVEEIRRAIGSGDTWETIDDEFEEVKQHCATKDIRQFVKCTLDLTLNSFEGYHISELYPKYREHVIHKSRGGFEMVYPLIMHPTCITSTSPHIIFESQDYYPQILNHFLYDKVKMIDNRIRYSSIELRNFNPTLMNTRMPMLNILYLLFILERVHQTEGLNINITVRFSITAPQKTQFYAGDGSLFDVSYSMLHSYVLTGETSTFDFRFNDLSENSLFRFVNRIYSLFQDENPKSQEPFLRVERDKFEEQMRLVKDGI